MLDIPAEWAEVCKLWLAITGGKMIGIYKRSNKVWIPGPSNLIEAEGVIRGVLRNGGTVRIVPQAGRMPFQRLQGQAGQPEERVKNSLK